jgi:hypothetical protein
MRARKFETLLAGQHVLLFFDARANDIGVELTTKLRARIAPLVEQLMAFKMEQESSISLGLGHTMHHEQLRLALYANYLTLIGRTAKSALRQTPEFPMLVLRSRMPDGEFVSAVAVLIGAAKPHEALLIEHGSSVDFIAGLQAALAEYKASTDTRSRLNSRRNAASKGIDVLEPLLKKAIDEAEAMMFTVRKADPVLAADWAASSKIHKRPINPLRGGSPNISDGSEPSPPTEPPTQPPTGPPDGTTSP